MNIYALMNTTAYKPKEARKSGLSVGTDIMPIRERAKPEAQRSLISIDDSSTISDAARTKYAQGRSKSVSLGSGSTGVSLNSGAINFSMKGTSWEFSVMSSGAEDGLNSMVVTNSSLKEEFVFQWKGDAKLDLSGPDGPRLLSGEDALTEGKLVGAKDGEVLLRASADVDGGASKNIVVGLNNKAGTFRSGQGGTQYVGTFEGSVINGSDGGDSFEGTFLETIINAGDGLNEYSGDFFDSLVEGGSGKDIFSGLFLGNSILKGNDGDDEFTGTFFDSKIDGGAGNDRYGKMTLYDARKRGKEFDGFVADVSFWGSSIVDEDGDNMVEGVFKESTAEFKNGNNTISGAFIESSVDAGDGNNTIRAFYAENSNFLAGVGNDTVRIATGMNNNVSAGDGSNEIGLGVGEEDSSWGISVENGGLLDMRGMRWGRDVQRGRPEETEAFGHQQGNFVDLGEGRDIVSVTVDGMTRVIKSNSEDKAAEGKKGGKEDPRPQAEIDAENELAAGAEMLAGASANAHLAGKTQLAPGEYINPYQKRDAARLMGKDAVRPVVENEEGAAGNEAVNKPGGTLEDKVGALIQRAGEAGVDRGLNGVTVALADGTTETVAPSTHQPYGNSLVEATAALPEPRILRAAMKAYAQP